MHIIGDRIDDRGNYYEHPASEDGKHFSSKSEFRKYTAAMGYVEKGDQTRDVYKPRQYRQDLDIPGAVDRVLNDMKYNPGKFREG